MPRAAPKCCTYAGCGRIVKDGGSRCSEHPYAQRFGSRERGTRQERGYGAEWERTRERILLRDEGLCQVCMQRGHFTLATAVDHIVGKAEARWRQWTAERTEADENLQSICDPCHEVKTEDEAQRARRGWAAGPAPAARQGEGGANPPAPPKRTAR
jgi:5-methylcytosine-specific restriction protein A